MGCFDDVVQVLEEIKGVLSNGLSAFGGVGNCGTNGSGLFEATPASFIDTGDNYPSGYASASEYKLAKCNLAEFWRRNVITSFQSVREINSISLTLSALAGVVAIVVLFPISGVILAAMAGALFELAAGGLAVYVAAIDEIIDYFRDELDICIVYEATTVDQAKANLHNDIDSFSWSNPLSASIAKYLVTFDTLNPIWSGKPETINLDALPEGDCSECGEIGECFYVVSAGSGPSYPGGDFTSSLVGANQYISLDYRTATVPGVEGCPQQVVTINSVSGHIDGALIVSYIDAAGGSASDDITGETLPLSYTTRGGPAGGSYFDINTGANGGQPFQANITFEDWVP